ncbi:MAG: SDR family oxidoreductase [Candidatus Scalindua sp. AMX11]|nr:MAG: SDR family NAD(P)-dependent oxidoreductase [Candidatus Scalindua sp.]NOG83619.1 SDR family oxidoreductase [Planctomycetota bacterium]RZV69630.1 MAG: SDR family oxidoreductase [Candidatus Scalindua sp. SCAELEC01]TDE64106.1 MAG: SDR family oxidoreductase [Candidatus Scalindua sp. AMX11]GJQ60148.1 MAG: short chain dehydrogenase [Candidatus Scalindua sp.]
MKKNHLHNKTALVTGATKRIGKAIANVLAENKVNVIIHHSPSSKETAEEVVTQIRTEGVKSWSFQADFSNLNEIDTLVKNIHEAVGAVDFLINNASIFPVSNLKTLDIQDLQHTLMVNSIAPFRLSQQIAKQNREGCIINFLDNRIRNYDLNHAAYQLSKNLLFHMTEMMAIDFAPRLRVNGIAPGLILPPVGMDESFLVKNSKRNLLFRYGTLPNITDAVLFLLSNTFITGEVLCIDGGQNLKEKSYERSTFTP